MIMSLNQPAVATGHGINSSEWWLPILQKHQLEVKSYINYGDIFEMGEKNSLNNNICTLTDAVKAVYYI